MSCETRTLLPTTAAFPLSKSFDYGQYIDLEQELWALFPEVAGKRVNFIQVGLSAFLYAEVDDDKAELANDETYVLMPHADNCLRQVRMKCIRRLSLDEYRMSTHTAIRAGSRILNSALQQAVELILGEELMADLADTLRGNCN